MKIILLYLAFVFSLLSRPTSTRTDLLLYGGKFTETDLIPILTKQNTDYKNSWISVLGVSQGLGSTLRIFDFEVEFNLVKHQGIMKHYEANGLLLARTGWNLFSHRMSFAFGEGFSLASENPKLENREKGFRILNRDFDFLTGAYILSQTKIYPFDTEIQIDSIRSRNILNFIMVELDYGFPQISHFPRIFVRIHHRSGVFGLYCPPDPACGSNFVSYGVKFSL